MVVAIRRVVPNDHSCLFWAVAYVAEGPGAARAKATELREVCAQAALQDPDPATQALILGHPTVEEYATWIRNEHHWGGEAEVNVLAAHYNLEITIICCEPMQVLCYGSGNAACTSRVYLLYTGQHYDAIVGGADPDTLPSDEQRKFPKGDASLEESALAVARLHNEMKAKRAKQRCVTRIKCGGCGALLNDNDAFAAHCGEVEHDDDFAYTCEEVQVVYEGEDDLPEGTLDLNSPDVHTFTNRGQDLLSLSYPEPVSVSGQTYPTLEHYFQASQFLGQDDDLASRVAQAPTVEQAMIVANGAGHSSQRPDWREKRYSLLCDGVRARAAQSPAFASALQATDAKTIVCLDNDPWAAMHAPGGVPMGQNNFGKALMEVRAELQSKMDLSL